MANEQLETFLAEESAAATAEPAAPAEAPPAAAPAQKPEAKPEPTSKAATAKPEGEDDAEIRTRLIASSVTASHTSRSRCSNASASAAPRTGRKRPRLEGELAAHASLSGRRNVPRCRATAAADLPAAAGPRLLTRTASRSTSSSSSRPLLNERLNNSEMMLREKIGDEEGHRVRQRVPRVGQQRSDAVQQALQPAAPLQLADPRGSTGCAWLRDVGDDPAAFRARIEARSPRQVGGRGQGAAEHRSLPPLGCSRRSPTRAVSQDAPRPHGPARQEP